MVAYACSPYRGSEPGVGWHRAVEVAQHVELWVITEEHEFRSDIERYLRENGPVDNPRFLFVPRISSSKVLWRVLSRVRPLYYLAYHLWHRRAYRLARQICRETHFDIVHQSTMCGFREPGLLWRLDLPFVWGPVGGTQNYPWRFLLEAGPGVAVVEGVRSILNVLQLRLARKVRLAAKRSALVLTAIPAGQQVFKRAYDIESECMLDVGVTKVADAPRSFQGRTGPLRLLWSGTLEHRKALQLLLKALARLPAEIEFELRILGTGPKQKSWQALATKLGVDRHCCWMGWLPHSEAMRQYRWADVFVFTSLRDTCGTVVLEALSHGLPVICLDHQGVGSVVTDGCGIKVQVTAPTEVVNGLRDAVIRASSDDLHLEALSRGAIQTSQDFLWRRHGQRLAQLYGHAIKAHRNAIYDHCG